MIIKKYQAYIYSLFIKKFILITLIFFCLVIIVNFFEEIRFSEKYNTEIYYSIYLSILNAPSLVFEIFPFIFLISVKIFYLSLSDKYELKIMNSNGINLSYSVDNVNSVINFSPMLDSFSAFFTSLFVYVYLSSTVDISGNLNALLTVLFKSEK